MPVFRWDSGIVAYVDLRTGEAVTPGPVTPEGPDIVPFASISTPGTMSQKVDSVGAGKKVSFLSGLFQFSDFNDDTHNYGLRMLIANGILGSGRSWTTFEMTPMSSTQGSRVPASNPPASNGQVNPLRLVRTGWEGNAAPIEVGGFTVQATNQGHLYNGVELYRVAPGSVFRDVLVKGVPGDLSREPGETFLLSTYRCVGSSPSPILITRTELDGRNSSGIPVAASGLGVNLSQDIRIENVNSHHIEYAHGYALYESSNLYFTDCKATDTKLNGFNFENVSGVVNLTRVTCERNGENHIGIFTNSGSAVYTITDPVYDGAKLKIRCVGYNGQPMTQNKDDIHLIVGGVERPDLIQWIN